MNTTSARDVLVIGHRNPDTDAIASAISFAALYKWQHDVPVRACHLDEIGPETGWLLKYLQLDPPQGINDVYLRVADVMEREVPRLSADQTLREAGQLMVQLGIRALPVVDGNEKLLGLVQTDTIAAHYLQNLALPQEVDLSVKAIEYTLAAELLSGDAGAVLHDRVWIATMTAQEAAARIGPGDIVVLGAQPDVQRAAIEAGAGALILTDEAPFSDELLARARVRETIVLRSAHTPFAAAQLLQQSAPVSRVMSLEVAQFCIAPDALLNTAREQLRRANLAALAVVDTSGRLIGALRRRHLTEQATRPIILTDHNHPDQAAPGVMESQLLAIVDHHNLGGLQTLQPLWIQIEPLGCCCTLIAEMYRSTGAPLSPTMAGLMLGAILSDTVQFRSPTTTARDRAAAEWLASVSGETIETLARQLFRARLPTPPPAVPWWVERDRKTFVFGEHKVSISQIELADVQAMMPPQSELVAALNEVVTREELDTALLLLTDILDEGSILLAANDFGAELAVRAFGKSWHGGQMRLPGVMSRKKQVVPPLALALGG